jgi:hypothetical protein
LPRFGNNDTFLVAFGVFDEPEALFYAHKRRGTFNPLVLQIELVGNMRIGSN